MTHKLLPVAIAGLSLLAVNAPSYAADAPTVYGKINASLNNFDKDSDGTDNWELESNASRLGVKGSFDVSEGLKAVYKMEYEVFIDDGDKSGQTFAQRNIYGGLQGSWGTLITGMHDSPLKLAQGKVDRFNDLPTGDIKNIMEGEDRVKNVILYSAPKFNGLSLNIALVPGEDTGAAAENDGLADHRSVSLSWSNDSIYAAVAMNDDVDSQDTLRAVADIKLGAAKIGFLWQSAEKVSDSSVDEDSYLISAEFKAAGDYVLKAQYGMTDYSNDDEDTLLAIGVDRKLGKNAKIYAYLAEVESDDGSISETDSTFGLGYEIKF